MTGSVLDCKVILDNVLTLLKSSQGTRADCKIMAQTRIPNGFMFEKLLGRVDFPYIYDPCLKHNAISRVIR